MPLRAVLLVRSSFYYFGPQSQLSLCIKLRLFRYRWSDTPEVTKLICIYELDKMKDVFSSCLDEHSVFKGIPVVRTFQRYRTSLHLAQLRVTKSVAY